jgi:DNA polymerase
MVIGEAPGRTEDEENKPFVGPSGKLAESWLTKAGLNVDDVAWANVVCCFPNRTPTSDEVAACSRNLAAQFSVVRPSHVLLFGGVALSAWWGLRIGILRGLWWKGRVDGLDYRPWFLATWHPSAVLRNRGLENEAFADVVKFKVRASSHSSSSSYIAPSYSCIECGDWAVTWRDHTGRDVTDVAGEESDGSLAWCQKHDDLRTGKGGRGRVKGDGTDGVDGENGDGKGRGKKTGKGRSRKESQQIALGLEGLENRRMSNG